MAGQCKPFIFIPRYFVIMESNKSESVISRDPSPEFPECRSVFISDFNSITPAKSILSPSRAIYTGHGCGSKNHLLHSKPLVSLVRFLLFHRFEIMENSKRYVEGALNGSASSHQCLRH